MYIRISNDGYYNDDNLREIKNFSGEVITGNDCIKATETMLKNVYPMVKGKGDYLYNKTTKKLQAKTVEQLTEEKLDILRIKRNELLQETDWVMTSDNTISAEVKTAYEVYRQALRDLPQNVDLTNIEKNNIMDNVDLYPVKP
jgi:hypothetical protein